MTAWLTIAFLLLGTMFVLLAAIGLLRMPDLFTRMHAATKLPTLGMSCVLLALAIHFGELAVTTRALLGIAFFFLTVPIAAQVIGRAAYHTGVGLWHGSVLDELRGRTGGEMVEAAGDAAPDEEAGEA
jgi:multicomponent Na+:H+ antiporter subunit G